MVHPLLDDEGEWTTKAREEFLPTMENVKTFVKTTNNETTEEFREKIKAMAPHKRLFFSHEALLPFQDRYLKPWDLVEISDSPIGSLYGNLIYTGLIRVNHQLKKEVHLSFKSDEEFLNIKYSSTSPLLEKFLRPKLGIFSPLDIKAGIFDNQSHRLCATFFPGTPCANQVHGSKELPGVVVRHDESHAHITKKYHDKNRKFILNVIKKFEMITHFKMSKEIWELTDMVFIDVLKSPSIDNLFEFITHIFTSDGAKDGDQLWKKLFLNEDNTLTLLGWITTLTIEDKINKKNLKREEEHNDGSVNLPANPSKKIYKPTPPPRIVLAFRKIENFRKQKYIQPNTPMIVQLWKLMLPSDSPLLAQDISESQLKFIKLNSKSKQVRKNKFYNNTVIIEKV
jgi:hypothetical protein